MLVYAKKLGTAAWKSYHMAIKKEGIDQIYEKVGKLKDLYGSDYVAMTNDLRSGTESSTKRMPHGRHQPLQQH